MEMARDLSGPRLGSQLDHTLRQASLCFKPLFVCRINMRPRSLTEMHHYVI